MLSFLLRRMAAVLPVLLVVSLVVFLILRLAPGDPAAAIAGNNATNEDIAKIRTQLGLDSSIPVQYGIWIGRVLQGDLGYSFYLSKPVTALITQRIEPTLALALGTVVLAVLIAVPLGTLAAWRLGGWLDRLLSGFSVAGFSIPVFVIGYLLIYLFAIRLEWLPVQGYKSLFSSPGSVGAGPWAWMRQLILPWMTLAMIYVALIARVTRASVSEALTEDYIRTARAKGLSERAVLLRHALANAAVPIVTVIGIGIALLIGGVVVTETVFAIPGLGSLTVDAVLNRDFPVIQGLVLLFSVSYVMVNLLVDLSYLFLDPRIRY
jgi:peptide/nickel transport system permease protein